MATNDVHFAYNDSEQQNFLSPFSSPSETMTNSFGNMTRSKYSRSNGNSSAGSKECIDLNSTNELFQDTDFFDSSAIQDRQSNFSEESDEKKYKHGLNQDNLMKLDENDFLGDLAVKPLSQMTPAASVNGITGSPGAISSGQMSGYSSPSTLAFNSPVKSYPSQMNVQTSSGSDQKEEQLPELTALVSSRNPVLDMQAKEHLSTILNKYILLRCALNDYCHKTDFDETALDSLRRISFLQALQAVEHFAVSVSPKIQKKSAFLMGIIRGQESHWEKSRAAEQLRGGAKQLLALPAQVLLMIGQCCLESNSLPSDFTPEVILSLHSLPLSLALKSVSAFNSNKRIIAGNSGGVVNRARFFLRLIQNVSEQNIQALAAMNNMSDASMGSSSVNNRLRNWNTNPVFNNRATQACEEVMPSGVHSLQRFSTAPSFDPMITPFGMQGSNANIGRPIQMSSSNIKRTFTCETSTNLNTPTMMSTVDSLHRQQGDSLSFAQMNQMQNNLMWQGMTPNRSSFPKYISPLESVDENSNFDDMNLFDINKPDTTKPSKQKNLTENNELLLQLVSKLERDLHISIESEKRTKEELKKTQVLLQNIHSEYMKLTALLQNNGIFPSNISCFTDSDNKRTNLN